MSTSSYSVGSIVRWDSLWFWRNIFCTFKFFDWLSRSLMMQKHWGYKYHGGELWWYSAATACIVLLSVAAAYPQSTCNGTLTRSSLSGIVSYGPYVTGWRNLDVYVQLLHTFLVSVQSINIWVNWDSFWRWSDIEFGHLGDGGVTRYHGKTDDGNLMTDFLLNPRCVKETHRICIEVVVNIIAFSLQIPQEVVR